jgi:hypothetical protein
MESRESVCRACRFNQRSNTVFQNPKVKKLYVDDYLSTQELERAFVSSRLMDYHDVESIKDLQYEGMDLGYGALSSYVSATRINEPLIDDTFREYFDRLLKVELSLVLAFKRVIESHQVKQVVVYNGRLHDVRPILLSAQKEHIALRVLEADRASEHKTLVSEFPGVMPQNIEHRTYLIRKMWEESTDNEQDRLEFAKSFYHKRRNNILIQDSVVYTSDQEQGLLPESWDVNRRNVVIFNSSEDEFTALGRDWDNLSLFESQLKGVAFIAEVLSQDPQVQLYVRVHPNLKGNPYNYHQRLYDLEKKYSQLCIIRPESPVSTYALIDAMNLGISFGSSAGIEAVASNKPVILLAGCYYYHLESCYVPKGLAELKEWLLQEKLAAKPILGALMYGYYMSCPDVYLKSFKYEVTKQKIGFLTYWNTPHMAFRGSSWMYKALLFAYNKRMSFKNRGLVSIVPAKELGG